MIFNLSGTTITATPETPNFDEPLIGLENVEGVTLSFKGNKRVYTLDFGNARFNLTGSGAQLLIDPEFEELVFRSDSTIDCLRIGALCIFKIGVEETINGLTRYSRGDALTMPRDTGAQFLIGSLDVLSGGRFEWRGGTIYAGDAMGCSIGGTAEIFAGRFVTTSTNTTNTTNASAMVMRNDGLPDDVICHGVELDSINPSTAAPVVFSRNGLNTFVFTALAGFVQHRNGVWTDALVLRGAEFAQNAFIYDFNFVGNNSNYGANRVQATEFFNIDVGTGLRQFSATNNLNGHISFFQDFKSVVSDISGNPIDGAVTYIGTVNHGNRVDDIRSRFQNDRTFSNDEFDSYRVISDLQGESDIELLTGRMWVRSSNTEQLDLYSNSGIAGVDDFTVTYFDYNSLPSFTPIVMHSSSEIVDNKSLLPDSLINEPDINIARAYTLQDTTSKVYDQLKAILFDNYRGEQETIVTKVLTNLNARDLDVVIKGQTTGQATIIGDTEALTGTAELVGNTVTFSTAQLFASRAKAGRFIELDGIPFVIESITNNTQLELTPHESGDIPLISQSLVSYTELTLHAPVFNGSITTTGSVTLEEDAIVTAGISDANGVSLVVNSNAQGGSFTMLNITKFLNNIGYFATHAIAQSANSNPNDGDYYRLDDGSEHAYFLGGAWVEALGRDIHEQTTTSSIIGGAGIASSHVVTAIDGHNYRVAVDAFGLYKKVQDVSINGLTDVNLTLTTNFNVLASRISDAIPYLVQIATEPPTIDGKIQLKLPQFNLNAGDDSDVDLASAVLELATLGEPSQSGAVVTNNATLAEIINAGVLTIQNDTVQLLPLDGMTASDITHIPLVVDAVNYTIDPTPLNATSGRVTHERVVGNIINTGSIVEPRLDAVAVMLPLVESIFHDTISLDTTT